MEAVLPRVHPRSDPTVALLRVVGVEERPRLSPTLIQWSNDSTKTNRQYAS